MDAVKIKTPEEYAAGGDSYDCTAFIGPLHQSTAQPEWPMYSYDRPSYMIWNAIAKALNAKGWTDAQIKDWLQSKNPRWALDGQFGDTLEAVAALFADSITKKDIR